MATSKSAAAQLLEWYRQNRRQLPWRANRDPYSIWISETMLQQTTTTAVIPFFERFLRRFPTLQDLAAAPIGHVLEAWAGLGYYSRARNLHRAAQELAQRGGFPRDFESLLELPGFGPYTARSVASLAFGQEVGVVDGNVIRVLSRFEAKAWPWWQSRERAEIQAAADSWVRGWPSHEMNQALMELGRTICTPKQPACRLCPLLKHCQAHAEDRVAEFPLPKPRRAREVWIWQPTVHLKKGQLLLQKNSDLPFLRDQWILPGTARKASQPPKRFDYKHTITHHDIFVSLAKSLPPMKKATTLWVELENLRQHAPTSLVHKAVAKAQKEQK